NAINVPAIPSAPQIPNESNTSK
ncbi:preprotein translocase subunit SecG, partial [Campylobacter coli]|nr:preprotein translocase subunit SecG [Campylobacter coli]